MSESQERDCDEEVLRALATVVEPVLAYDLVALGLVERTKKSFGRGEVTVRLPIKPYPFREELIASTSAALSTTSDFRRAKVTLVDADDASQRRLEAVLLGLLPAGATEAITERRPSFAVASSPTRILGISSGKGGVGKSSVTVNLALALARLGKRVGILDADIYGFSIPKMLGVEETPALVGSFMVPPRSFGVSCMSIGFFLDEDSPVVWRGPMLHKALEQFVVDVFWGPLDFLVVDMPPGTGDVVLSLGEFLPRCEIYVVTTPQRAAHAVAQRSAFAAKKLKLPLRGVIENMSYFVGHDGERYEIFGSGGGEELASVLSLPLLAQVPLEVSVRDGGDRGEPVVVSDPEGAAAQVFVELAQKIAAFGAPRRYRQELKIS
jgi:ATP-binding protein involved in chromosome partitioning